MNFVYKCYLQKIISSIPRGEKINYLFQRFISKSLPRSNKEFLDKVNTAYQHYNNFKKYNKLECNSYKYYEFGAGWDLIIPLSMCCLNFDVYCIDIRKLATTKLITDSINKFQLNKSILPFRQNDSFHDIDLKKKSFKNLRETISLNYYAPFDARNSQFPDQYFDFISSTVTFEYIPKNDILPILDECYRILKKGGVFTISIDYQDHWSFFDKSISVYNFLKYSSKEWEKYNPSLNYQNRLRHSDYLALISQTDFNIVLEIPLYPSNQTKQILKFLSIDKSFEGYDLNDISIIGSEIVLIK